MTVKILIETSEGYSDPIEDVFYDESEIPSILEFYRPTLTVQNELDETIYYLEPYTSDDNPSSLGNDFPKPQYCIDGKSKPTKSIVNRRRRLRIDLSQPIDLSKLGRKSGGSTLNKSP